MASADLAFDLEYEGPALETHEMDVRELAPALLHTAELFQRINRHLRPTDPDITVNVRATAPGSFSVNLSLVFATAVATLSSPEAVATINLLQVLDYGGRLIDFIKRAARLGVVKQEPSPDDDSTIDVTFGDGAKVSYPTRVLDLEGDVSIRRELNEIVKPLSREGIDSVRYRRERVDIARIDKEDVRAFVVPPLPAGQVVSSSEDELYLSVATINWRRGNKWQFNDGQTLFWAEILDETFWDKVEADTPIRMHDQLYCRVRRIQQRDDDGNLKSETQVLRVIRHEPPTHEQRALPFTPPE